VSRLLLIVAACRSDGNGPPTPTGTETGVASGETGTGSTVTTGTVGGFTLEVDGSMPLMIHATFVDPGASEAWVEYRFETDEWLIAPTFAPGAATILGIPPLTEVEARAFAVVSGRPQYSKPLTVTTGDLPPILLEPSTSNYDPKLASSAQYAMISVASGNFTFEGPYFIEIFDRAGRVVWYHRVRDELFSLYPSVARDGTHIWFEAENIFGFSSADPSVTRRTLDGRWTLEFAVPYLGQAIGEGPDNSFFYEYRRNGLHAVNQLDAAGAASVVWDCESHMESIGENGADCLLNATNWDPTRNTVLASQFQTSTVFEVDLATGQAARQFGQLTSGDPYTFDPVDSMFAYQHFPNWTAEGTLLVSTHVPCGSQPGCSDNNGRDGIQLASEYVIDDKTKTITRIGFIRSDDLWATQAGEAYRLPNGNLIQGYGQDGAAREYTADGQVAWQVEWEKDLTGYRAVGHLSLIDDLYALNVGQ
jgi:Arylsulfotransferase (ASST)